MLLGWLVAMLIIGYMIYVQHKHHPKALFFLFFTEMWERFSYYGMRALLMLYMTKGILLGDTASAGIYGAYVSLVYATPVIGGILSERFLGLRNAIMIGGLLMALGHFALAIEIDWVFYIALSLLALGNGFFKPNISTLVGKFYFAEDPRRDSAFTIFYMGVNTGAFLAPLMCGFLGEQYGWHYGFGAAGLGMVIGLVVFGFAGYLKVLEDKGTAPKIDNRNKWNGLLLIGLLVAVPSVAFMISNASSTKYILWLVALGAFLYLVYLSFQQTEQARYKLMAIAVLFVFTVLFWTFFELAGSVLTLYTDRNIDRSIDAAWLQRIFCGEIKTSEFQSINPFFIILLAPVFSAIWQRWQVSSGMKFLLALLQLGIGFMVLVWGAQYANHQGFVPMIFMIVAYLFFTTGELCLSPIGLSLVTKMSPSHLVSTVMGIWLLAATIAGILGTEIGELTAIESKPNEVFNNIASLDIYTHTFQWIAFITFVAVLILAFLIKPLKKWMHE
jgi:POT family proton-dependent oligopeptide transporter